MLGHLPSIENLQCFLAAAEHLNFRRASEQMALSPAAFGQRIQQLEETVGERLFARTTRTVELTAAGRQMLPVAREVVRAAGRCREVLHQDRAPVRLTLGTRFELGLSWVVPAVIAMREQMPELTVDLYFGSSPDILERLEGGQLDCVITSAPQSRTEWGVEFLHREEYVFVASPGLVERRAFEAPSDAEHHTLIDVDETLPLSRYLTSMVEEPMTFDEILIVGAGEAIQKMVRAGLGVGVLPVYMVRDELDDGRLVPIMEDVDLLADSFRLLYRRAALLDATFERIAEFLRARPLE